MKMLSKFMSWVFLPLLTPVYALALACYYPTIDTTYNQATNLFFLPPDAKLTLLYLFCAFSFLFPSLTLIYLLITGKISSIMLDNRSERIIPSITVNLFALLLICFLYQMVPVKAYGYFALIGLAIGSFFTVLIATIITLRWKISLHAAGMGILTGFMFAYYSLMTEFPTWIIPSSFIASGAVMSARMYLGAHDLKQSFYGFALGFIATFTTIYTLHLI